MLDRIKLKATFNTDLLKCDVANLNDDDWVRHFNTQYYTGMWAVVPLRSVGGSSKRIYPDPTSDDFCDTEILNRCPGVKAVLQFFQCELRTVRFLKLTAGSSILEHSDNSLAHEDGMVRFHIPVITNPDVEFYLNRERVNMVEGECWYLDFNLPHYVDNHSTEDRIHLVVDCHVNDWVTSLLVDNSRTTTDRSRSSWLARSDR
ncbi:MAG: hypothetical protein QOH96_2216 [Blastocatellia bacterium]|nr:hypothetical protein [Blastocatellia bacterium]